MTVAITRLEHSASELRVLAAAASDVAVARRLLALAMVLDGRKREDAARAAGMDRQTLRDWVHRYNAGGVAGLADRHGGGAQRRLSDAQEATVAGWVREGPDMADVGIVRWRCVDLQKHIAERLEVHLAERSVGKLLRRLGFSRVSARPRHPQADKAAQASFRPGSALS